MSKKTTAKPRPPRDTLDQNIKIVSALTSIPESTCRLHVDRLIADGVVNAADTPAVIEAKLRARGSPCATASRG